MSIDDYFELKYPYPFYKILVDYLKQIKKCKTEEDIKKYTIIFESNYQKFTDDKYRFENYYFGYKNK